MYVRNPKKSKLDKNKIWYKTKKIGNSLGKSKCRYHDYDLPEMYLPKKCRQIDQDKSDISSMYDLCDLDEECEDVVEEYLCEMNEEYEGDEGYDLYETYVMNDDRVYPYIDTTWMNVERNG